MLAPSSEAAFGERLLLALSLESAQRWPAFAAELAERSGRIRATARAAPCWRRATRDDAAALERELAFRESLGLTVARLLPSRRAATCEPALAPTLRAAAAAPDDHAVDPRALLRRARRRASRRRRRAARGRRGDRARAGGGRASGVRLAGGERLAAGRSSSRRAPGRARSAACRTTPACPCARSRARSCACATRRPGPARARAAHRGATSCRAATAATCVGATVEERGFDRRVTAGGVLRAAARRLRGAARASPSSSSRRRPPGCGPGTPDNAPAGRPGALRRPRAGPPATTATAILLAPLTADARRRRRWPASRRAPTRRAFARTASQRPRRRRCRA